ncbi:HNH endonuclease [Nitrosomonas nitrosa]|uniref:HNH endonuclease n=2 Tax=Nitrosomonas nitrosa TaxID=52442 RepID=A0A1I4TK59_9PROT|nr:HNH endonuclease domain-containing protein [Nitrosomonas nitrosa]MCW5598422.1 HNH endonuclease [Nitrosomonas sp.]SFM76957.1 HNH endonuclease [Nitrosomonas nitrosa]
MSRFYEIEPTTENYWRAIILFGRNSASYKFALAKALFDFQASGKTQIPLDELAIPYASHLCEHLKNHPKQGTSEQSTFLDKLRAFNQGEITRDEMLSHTLRYGFVNVLDAFHNVHGKELETRFFIDERKRKNAVQLTDDFMLLGETQQFSNLIQETESRWRLVEAAWENNLPRNLMLVEYEEKNSLLIGANAIRRTAVTAARPALNGYQKGRCFYCYREISIVSGNNDIAEVDHFFPHMLKQCDSQKPIDGIANLVLACQECNRGQQGKFNRLPSVELLERLFNRNEYLITSHHPLRETLISQTGNSTEKRQAFLQDAYTCSSLHVGASGRKWQPKPQGPAIF